MIENKIFTDFSICPNCNSSGHVQETDKWQQDTYGWYPYRLRCTWCGVLFGKTNEHTHIDLPDAKSYAHPFCNCCGSNSKMERIFKDHYYRWICRGCKNPTLLPIFDLVRDRDVNILQHLPVEVGNDDYDVSEIHEVFQNYRNTNDSNTTIDIWDKSGNSSIIKLDEFLSKQDLPLQLQLIYKNKDLWLEVECTTDLPNIDSGWDSGWDTIYTPIQQKCFAHYEIEENRWTLSSFYFEKAIFIPPSLYPSWSSELGDIKEIWRYPTDEFKPFFKSDYFYSVKIPFEYQYCSGETEKSFLTKYFSEKGEEVSFFENGPAFDDETTCSNSSDHEDYDDNDQYDDYDDEPVDWH